MTQIQLDTGFLDIPEGVDFPITISFLDIKDGSRSGGFSKTIEIDATPNNSKLLGYYFDVDLEGSDTFNRNTKTKATVIQQGSEVFSGYVQLMEVIRENKNSNTGKNLIKYKINVFDEVSNFFIEMGEKELSELSFPEFTHVFERSTIINSWDNTEGYVYPQFATDYPFYTLKDFKPAIFELDYFKKIFEVNGYTYKFDQLTDNDIRLDKRIIPFNGAEANEAVTELLKNNFTFQGVTSGKYVIDDSTTTVLNGRLPSLLSYPSTPLNTYVSGMDRLVITTPNEVKDSQNQWSTDTYTNKAGDGRTLTITAEYDYKVDMKGNDGGSDVAVDFQFSGAYRMDVILSLFIQSKTDPTKNALLNSQVVQSYNSAGSYSFPVGYTIIGSGFNASSVDLGEFDNLEELEIIPLIYGVYYDANNSVMTEAQVQLQKPIWFKYSADPSEEAKMFFNIGLTNLKLQISPDVESLEKGTVINMDAFIPKKIKQKDIISSIAKSYNLVFEPSSDSENEIIIKTRDKYYSEGGVLDWTEKFAEDKPNSISFISNDRNRRQEFTYKSDKDAINEAYQDEVKEVYGTARLNLDNEYTSGVDKTELIYSPTPSIKSGVGMVLPTINGISPENNVRVLLNNGKKKTHYYAFFDNTDGSGTPLMVNEYLDSSMFDNDFKPNFSLCFDAPRILFHSLQQSKTNNYLYNLHYKKEVTNINNGSILTGYFNLNQTDFYKLSKKLNWKVFIKDNGWFYIGKVHNYNANKRTLTKVELITADDDTKIKYTGSIGEAPAPIPRLPSPKPIKAIEEYFGRINFDTNKIINSVNVDIKGRYNLVKNATNVDIIGDKNEVLASNTVVMGNSNLLKQGSNGAKVIGDEGVYEKGGVYTTGQIPNNIIWKAKIQQTGTTPPTLNVLVNPLGLNVTSGRIMNGLYDLIESSGLLTTDTTVENSLTTSDINREVRVAQQTPNVVSLNTYLSGSLSDGVLIGVNYATITVYKYD